MIMTEFKNRMDVSDQEKWDLTDIYKTIENWENDYQKIETLTEDLKNLMELSMMVRAYLPILRKVKKYQVCLI